MPPSPDPPSVTALRGILATASVRCDHPIAYIGLTETLKKNNTAVDDAFDPESNQPAAGTAIVYGVCQHIEYENYADAYLQFPDGYTTPTGATAAHARR